MLPVNTEHSKSVNLGIAQVSIDPWNLGEKEPIISNLFSLPTYWGIESHAFDCLLFQLVQTSSQFNPLSVNLFSALMSHLRQLLVQVNLTDSPGTCQNPLPLIVWFQNLEINLEGIVTRKIIIL